MIEIHNLVWHFQNKKHKSFLENEKNTTDLPKSSGKPNKDQVR